MIVRGSFNHRFPPLVHLLRWLLHSSLQLAAPADNVTPLRNRQLRLSLRLLFVRGWTLGPLHGRTQS